MVKAKMFIKQFIISTLVVMTCLLSSAYALTRPPLPDSEAFELSTQFIRPGVIMVRWKIAPDYYLYVKRVNIAFSPTTAVDMKYPPGEIHANKQGGKDEVYSGTVQVLVTFAEKHQPLTMTIDYQGCAKDGFCYPPMNKTFMLNFAQMTVNEMSEVSAPAEPATTLHSLLTDQNHIDQLLQDQGILVMMIIFAGIGLLLAFTPCVLPMVPILASIIVGQKHAPGSKKAFLLSLSYVLGMSVTYAIAGMVAASLGNSIQVWLQKPATIIIVSLMFVLLALSLFGLYELKFSRRWHNWIYAWSNKHEGGTYAGVFIMGVLSTLVVSPCVTAPLVGVLIYIGHTGNLVLGASALFVMGLGMGIPLLLIGMSAGRWLPKSGVWMKAIKEMFGIFMVAMAIWLLSRILTSGVTQILYGLLLLGSSVFVGVYLPHLIRFKNINRTMGLAAAMLGLLLVYNGVNMRFIMAPVQSTSSSSFIIVHNISDFDKYITQAQTENRPILLDFYADWCESCVQMDRNVFTKSTVKNEMSNFIRLRADLSENTAADGELLKRFGVIAPPTVLFFNTSGKEVNSHRIVGELDESEFLSRIHSFTSASCATKIQC